MLYLLIFSFTCIIASIIILIVSSISHSKTQKNLISINNQIEQFLTKSNFKTTKIFYLTDYYSVNKSNLYKKMICIDGNNHKIALIDYNGGKLHIIEFKDIINYEIYKNGNTSTSGGAVGAWYIGLFGAETEETIKEFKLIIRINSIETPQVVYDIVSNTPFNWGINKSSTAFQECMKPLQEFTSFLEVILNKKR